MFNISPPFLIGFILIVTQIFITSTRGFDCSNSDKKLLLICVGIFFVNLTVCFLIDVNDRVDLIKLLLFSSTIFVYFLINLLLKKLSIIWQKEDFSMSLENKHEENFGNKLGYSLLDKLFSAVLYLSSFFITLISASIIFKP